MALTHESLTVYQQSIQFVAWAHQFSEVHGFSGELLAQFKRAFISIPLNIAEGNGKFTPNDQAKFYGIARGSSLECGACLDVAVAMKYANPGGIDQGKCLLKEIVAMLTALSRSTGATKVNEPTAEYTTESP
jgi:four helix bundle protein